jgi:RNA polymerase sigma-70 factor (ECF subfamily)
MADDTNTYEEFATLVAETQASVRGFVRMLGAKDAYIDDIAQEAYIVAFQRFDFYDPEKSFLSWVRGIARNILLNERRKAARHRRIINENLTDALAAEEPGESVTYALELSEFVAAMRECMEDLSPRHQSLLLRRYEQDQNASELAVEVSMSAGAVRQALKKTRDFLQKCSETKAGALPA